MTYLLVGLGAIGIVLFFIWLKNRKPNTVGGVDWSKEPQGSVKTSNRISQTTPKGARVLSQNGVSSNCLDLVDLGLDDVFQAAKDSGYTNDVPLVHGFYDIMIPVIDCVPSPEQKIPSFLIRADNYDGTEFDQYNPKGNGVKDGIGVTFCAEMVLSLGTPGSSLLRGQMVCCSDESVIREATRNGAEHIIIAHNDPNYYWETETHTTKGHPLLPHLQPQLRGFASLNSGELSGDKFEGIIRPVL